MMHPDSRCRRCLYAADTPAIVFDAQGICNYCQIHDRLHTEHPTGTEGRKYLETMAERIRHEGRGKPYDVIVGVSGGTDSSYMLWLAKDLRLRPLAVHFDNTWNSGIATDNIQNMLTALDIPLETYVVDNLEYDEIYRAFLRSGVRDIDAPTDIGLAAVLYRSAERHGIRTIFEGHSFRTEGIAPLGWAYMDGKYIESVVRMHSNTKLKTFPNMKMADFLRWTALRRIRKIRPLYHVDYIKEDAKVFLRQRYGWKDYGGHHLENRFTAFLHTFVFPKRFGVDSRLLGWSALVRSGQLDREEGMTMLAKEQAIQPELIRLVQTRLGFSDTEFAELMALPQKTYRDYRTYKETFERFAPVFRLLAHFDLVPKSFVIKYTSKSEI